MEHFEEPNKQFEKLSKAILKAIFSSKEIKKLVNELQDKNFSFDNSHMVIVMNMKTLSNINNEEALSNNPFKRKQKNGHSKHIIDGRVMSENEIKFNEYCSKNFNEKNWLKNIGIIFEED